MTKRIRKAIFPIAGLGERLLPVTKHLPKEMAPIIDKPIVQYAMDEARAAGIEEFIFVTGRNEAAAPRHVDMSYEQGRIVVERGKAGVFEAIRQPALELSQPHVTHWLEPFEHGHAVWCARNMIGHEPFAVLLANEFIFAEKPCLQQMVEAFGATEGHMVAAMEVPRSEVPRHGILKPTAIRGRLIEASGLVENPAPALTPSTLAVAGRYILQPEIFASLERCKSRSGNETRLVEAMAQTIDRHPLRGYLFDGQRFDCSDDVGFLEANIVLALARPDMAGTVERMIDRYSSATRKHNILASARRHRAVAVGDWPFTIATR
jgi:UTP--glucose-1-phosphate uridylyltransferase